MVGCRARVVARRCPSRIRIRIRIRLPRLRPPCLAALPAKIEFPTLSSGTATLSGSPVPPTSAACACCAAQRASPDNQPSSNISSRVFDAPSPRPRQSVAPGAKPMFLREPAHAPSLTSPSKTVPGPYHPSASRSGQKIPFALCFFSRLAASPFGNSRRAPRPPCPRRAHAPIFFALGGRAPRSVAQTTGMHPALVQ